MRLFFRLKELFNLFLFKYVYGMYKRQKNMNEDKEKGMPNYMSPSIVKEQELERKGYTTNFKITEEGLQAVGTGKVYKQNELKIVEHFRFEGVSDPDYMDVLYVIEANDGIKGIVVDAFGAYSDAGISEFFKGVKDETIKGL